MLLNKPKIMFVAQFPPPIHGLSKAVSTLANSISNRYQIRPVNLTNNRIISILYKVIFQSADMCYLTISQTKKGNLRDLMVLSILLLRREKVVIHLHGSYYRTMVDSELSGWQRKLNYKLLSRVSAAIVLSPTLRSIFFGMVADEKIYSVDNCIDDEFMPTMHEIEKKIIRVKNESVHHVLYLSNFIESKGYLEVLQIAREEQIQRELGCEPKLHFDFAGKFFDPGQRNTFTKYLRDNNLEDVVTYHGIVGGDEKKALLHKCATFVLLTRYPKEGQPISIIEAMGNGCSILSTNHAAIPDMVNSENGDIVDKDNLPSAKELYQLILNEISKLPNIAITNYKKTETRYSQLNYTESISRIFNQVVRQRG